jgi:hypothetical protein
MSLILASLRIPESHSHESRSLESEWAFRIPNIDGIFSNGEWNDSASMPIIQDGNNFKLYAKNDDRDIYLGIIWYSNLSDLTANYWAVSLDVFFDERHDGVLVNGEEDRIGRLQYTDGVVYIWDGFWLNRWESDPIESKLIAPFKFQGLYDTYTKTYLYFYEMRVKIGANSDSRDLDLVNAGNVVGFTVWLYLTGQGDVPHLTVLSWPDPDPHNDPKPDRWADLTLSSPPNVKPDLSIANFGAFPSNVFTKSNFTVSFDITNVGNGSLFNTESVVNYPTELYLVGFQNATVNIGNLGMNNSIHVSWILGASKEGIYEINVNLTGSNIDPIEMKTAVNVVGIPSPYDDFLDAYNALKTSYDTLQSQYNSLNSNYTALQTENDNLKSRLATNLLFGQVGPLTLIFLGSTIILLIATVYFARRKVTASVDMH